MTNANGVCFLSYRRTHATEAELIVAALRDRGVPTWQDVSDLRTTPTEDELRRVLADPNTSSAVLFVTPDVEHSPVIRDVEAPAIVRRHLAGDGFAVVPVAAGGLGYADMANVLGPNIGPTHMPSWNVFRTAAAPLDEAAASTIANLVLDQRLAEVQKCTPVTDPICVAISTRAPLPKYSQAALTVDLTHRFTGRVAPALAWERNILPGLRSIAHAVQRKLPNRRIEFSGTIAIPAAVALGSTFISVGGIAASWKQDQQTFGRAPEVWGLHSAREVSDFQATTHSHSAGARDLAILVSVAADVTADFNATLTALPPLRGVISVAPRSGFSTREPLTPAKALDVAHLTIDAMRTARATFHTIGTCHLFLAVPVGLAMMIGQLLNTFGRVQTYEHVPGGPVPYQPAALLTPSI